MTDWSLTPPSDVAPDKPARPKETRAETRHRLEQVRQAKMREEYGPGPVGQTCAGCWHIRYFTGNTRTYIKCELYGVSSAESTDWRAKWPACGRFTKDKP